MGQVSSHRDLFNCARIVVIDWCTLCWAVQFRNAHISSHPFDTGTRCPTFQNYSLTTEYLYSILYNSMLYSIWRGKTRRANLNSSTLRRDTMSNKQFRNAGRLIHLLVASVVVV